MRTVEVLHVLYCCILASPKSYEAVNCRGVCGFNEYLNVCLDPSIVREYGKEIDIKLMRRQYLI